MRPPRVLVFDSGLGGLTVLREIRVARPDAAFTYVADTAGFPYGALGEAQVVRRVMTAVGQVAAGWRPDVAVIACNTASTLVLPHLRAAFDFPFVGTVPAIKPAASITRAGLISVLATPGTVERDYTRALIETYAYHRDVTLVGAMQLATLAERALRGQAVDEAAIVREIAPAFVERHERRTDVVVLACTHYPLLLERLERLAPWPVTWIDPAPAIARRAASLIAGSAQGSVAGGGKAVFTGADEDAGELERILAPFGLAGVHVLNIADADPIL
jgi:glutamate racemase